MEMGEGDFNMFLVVPYETTLSQVQHGVHGIRTWDFYSVVASLLTSHTV